MKQSLLLLFCSFALLAQPAASEFLPVLNEAERETLTAGEVVIREGKAPDPAGKAYELVGMVNASGQILFEILTDYEAYPEFMSAVERVEIFAENTTESTLSYTLKPILGLAKRYRINILSQELKPGVWKLEWYLVPWPGLEPMETLVDTQGYWLIIEETSGRCMLQYFAYSDPGTLPLGLRSVVNALAKRSVKEVFKETSEWAERKFNTGAP